MYDIIIIGSGVSGYAGAMYAGRLGMKTLLVGEMPGGTITLTDVVENYPGFKKLTGVELANKLREHAEEYNAEIIIGTVKKIEKKDSYFVVKAEKEYETKTILFVTGTKHRELNVPEHDKYRNRGIHYCALCDAYFYRGKTVAVVGGSDSAAKDALVLARVAKKVYIIYRGEKIHPEPINLRRINNSKNIEVINNSNIVKITEQNEKLSGVILDREYNGSKNLNLDGIFVAIGLIPLSDLAKSIGVKTNEKKEIIINKESKTNVTGVFAAGDVTNTKFKQAITGVAEACTAAFFAHELLDDQK